MRDLSPDKDRVISPATSTKSTPQRAQNSRFDNRYRDEFDF